MCCTLVSEKSATKQVQEIRTSYNSPMSGLTSPLINIPWPRQAYVCPMTLCSLSFQQLHQHPQSGEKALCWHIGVQKHQYPESSPPCYQPSLPPPPQQLLLLHFLLDVLELQMVQQASGYDFVVPISCSTDILYDLFCYKHNK